MEFEFACLFPVYIIVSNARLVVNDGSMPNVTEAWWCNFGHYFGHHFGDHFRDHLRNDLRSDHRRDLRNCTTKLPYNAYQCAIKFHSHFRPEHESSFDPWPISSFWINYSILI